LHIVEVAEKGVFNLPDCSPLESAKRANLYELMLYQSINRTRVEFEKVVAESK